ncbi:MAG: hypothetical protein H7221_06545 [Flavobacterium sp.]|nr:hypothetical protein [Flavobacterium sp.]
MKSYFCDMKLVLSLLILLFIINQSQLTFAVLINCDAPTSILEDFSEDDNTSFCKELAINLESGYYFHVIFLSSENTSIFFSQNNLIIDSLPATIFANPPELV